jgi:hypothetical protein
VNAQTKSTGTDQQAQTDRDIVYAFAYCEAKIEGFSRSSGIPFPTLTTQVADLLYISAGRQPMGTLPEVRAVRGGSANRAKRVPKMAVARGSRVRRTRRMKHHRRGELQNKVMEVISGSMSALEVSKAAKVPNRLIHSALSHLTRKKLLVKEGNHYRVAA